MSVVSDRDKVLPLLTAEPSCCLFHVFLNFIDLQTWQREWERRIASFFRFFSLSTFHSLVSASSCLNLHCLPQPVLQAPFAKSRGTSTRRSSSVWCALMTGIASERTAPNTPTPVSIALLVPLFTHTHSLSFFLPYDLQVRTLSQRTRPLPITSPLQTRTRVQSPLVKLGGTWRLRR